MAAYIPNPTDTTEPIGSVQASTAAAEFRALKAYIQTVLATAGIGGLNMYRKNKIINGDFFFDQRNEGVATALGVTGAGVYVADKFFASKVASSTVTGQQTANILGGGAANMMQLACTVPHAAAAADKAVIITGCEGYDTADLLWGTALAKPISISFLYASPVTGQHCVYLHNAAENRYYIATFNVPVANTAQFVSINNIPGDTAGTWRTDNGLGITVGIDQGSGTNFEAPAGSVWGTGAFTRLAGAAKPETVAGNTNTTMWQLEQGAAASAFDWLFIPIKKLLCQRYFWKTYEEGVAIKTQYALTVVHVMDQLISLNLQSALGTLIRRFPVPMRVSPTIVAFSPLDGTTVWFDVTLQQQLGPTAFSVANSSTLAVKANANPNTGTPVAPGNGDVCVMDVWASADFY